MKILIISGMTYPTLSPRAFRTSELAQEFSNLGHDVTVYIPDNGFDYCKYNTFHNIKVKKFRTRYLKMNPSKGYSLLDRIFIYLFKRLLEYPYIELKFRVPHILKTETEVDLLITIAFPHTIHWGAAQCRKRLKGRFPKVWISDCGDPFMGDAANRHPFYFSHFEKKWGRSTDLITIPIEEARSAYYPEFHSKIRVVPQGFNISNVSISETLYSAKDNVIHFAYAGAMYPGKRELKGFLDYLISFDKPFIFTVYTSSLDYFYDYKNLLGNKLEVSKYIPRDELLFELSRQDFLINLTNPSSVQSPSKLIDYLLTKRPILDVSTPFSDYSSFEEAYNGIRYSDYSTVDITQYDIRNVAVKFLMLFNDIVNENLR